MAGRYPEMSSARIARLESQGRGTGERSQYKPWLLATEITTFGRMNRWYGIKAQRVHHFHSDLEAGVLPLAEFDRLVTDICEQFPLLPLSRTITLAKAFGIRHPRRRRGGNSVVMTTDLLLSTPSDTDPERKMAIAIKQSAELSGPKARRTKEKLLLEEAYWVTKGVPFHVVTEKDLNPTVSLNLSWLREAWLDSDEGEGINASHVTEARRFAKTFRELPQTEPLNVLIESAAKRSRIKDGLNAFRRCVWLRLIPIDLRHRIRLDQPPCLTADANLGVTFPWYS